MEGIPRLKEIALSIKRARLGLGLTQKKLALLAGISQAALARIEREPEEYNPGYSAVFRVVEALNGEFAKRRPESVEYRRVSEIMHRKIVSVNPHDSFHKALELMKDRGFSQLPVIDEHAALVGTVFQRQIVGLLLDGKSLKTVSVGDVMEPALPMIGGSATLKQAKSILEQWPAFLVAENGRVAGIVTSYDWFKAAK